MTVYNIYCDESCHLESDGQPIMVFGALRVPEDQVAEISRSLRALKAAHGLGPGFEVKWTKVSGGKSAFYLDLIRFFLEEPNLAFRGLVVTDKSRLRHQDFDQDSDTFYYKMFYQLLHVLTTPPDEYRVYLDVKDTRGGQKADKLRQVLRSSLHDWNDQVIRRVQIVRSEEIEILQLVDLLIGAISYANRGLSAVEAKRGVIAAIETGANARLTGATSRGRAKFDLFRWSGQAART